MTQDSQYEVELFLGPFDGKVVSANHTDNIILVHEPFGHVVIGGKVCTEEVFEYLRTSPTKAVLVRNRYILPSNK